jgi:transcriptional regulator with PAS, ATPase and Fis domain
LSLPDTQTIAKQANAEGGNEVSENTEATAVEETVVAEETTAVEETAAPAEDVVAEDAPADTVEKAADVSEVMVDEPDFAKMLVDLKGFFSETLNKASEVNAAQVTAIQETVDTFSKNVDSRITEMAEQHAALSKAVEDIRGTIDGVQKRVDAVESETAIKKSSDLGGSEVFTKSKSKWNGSFLGSVSDLVK